MSMDRVRRGYNGKAWTGVSNRAVLQALEQTGQPTTVKEIGRMISSDMTVERNLKAVSNSCGYLVKNNLAHRVGAGTYQAGPGPQEGKAMTMTEFPGIIPEDPPFNGRPTAAPPEVEQLHCEICGKPVASEMGRKNHMTRSHPKGLNADEAFERTGQALEVLFPGGIPMSRLIEIAELQKAMLRAIK